MSIRKKISLLFIGIVTGILICNNAIQIYVTRNLILEKEREQLQLIANTIASQIQQADTSDLYAEELLAKDLRKAAIAIEQLLPPKAADVTNVQLENIAQLLGVSEITLLQKTLDGKELVGVKSTNVKEIGMNTGQWGFWNDAMLQLINGQSVTVNKGTSLPNYWSGPKEIAASDPSFVDKYGYYYDGKTDYLINPFMRGESVMYYKYQYGSTRLIKEISNRTKGVLDITIFNPRTFGERNVAVRTNGSYYTRLKDEPVVGGSYKFRDKRDVTYVQRVGRTGERSEYYSGDEGNEFKVFYPIQITKQTYVVGIVFDYNIVKRLLWEQMRYYFILSGFILIGIIIAAWFFSNSLTNSLLRIIRRVNEVASGDFGKQIAIKRRDEIGTLAMSVNLMSVNLQKFTKELEEKQEQIEYQANYDFLTDLPNRRLMQLYVGNLLEQIDKKKETIALFFLDVDNFKTVNDIQGHHIGDALIKQLGERLRTCLPEETFVARQGGDEFIVVCRSTGQEKEVHHVANQILACLQAPFFLNGEETFVQVSIGGSLYSEQAKDLDTMIRYSDIAMYDAKKAGGNRFVMYGVKKSQVEEELAIQHKLTRAIEAKVFEVCYQPKVNLQYGTIVGAEVLVRWYDEESGFISPDVFIPIAEKLGLIHSLWEIVMDQACAQVQRWKEQGYSIPIAVNFSAQQFQNHSVLIQDIQSFLVKYEVEPHLFEIELTESTLMQAGASVSSILEKIKKTGICIAVDDFGVGYSSLSYLETFPLDTLKIDRSFIDGMEGNEKKRQIVELIITLAKKLDLKVVAEGVETEEQRCLLRKWKCDEAQGYLLSKPLSAKEFERLYQRSRVRGQNLQS